MRCLRCGNEDKNYFYKGHKGYYCRKCVKYKRIVLEEEIKPLDYEIALGVDDVNFAYPLTKFQEIASKKTLEHLRDSDVLLNCVCGAGKTEIVVLSMKDYLSRGLKVCYAISRKEVVIELEKRFRNIFKDAKVVAVYGGHHDELWGDIIVATTHQLYRYFQTFDLLILDEVDAFPLKGDETLMNIALNSTKGRIIFSTATVDDFLEGVLKKRKYETVELYIRPSYRPLVIPKIIYYKSILCYLLLYILMSKMTNQCIIFVSSREECEKLFHLYRHLFSCTYVYSDLLERNENINAFRKGEYKFIFATTVLERGITIPGVSVIIFYSRRKAFEESALIQMLGRVGRSITRPEGDAYILMNSFSKEVMKTMDYLKKANDNLEMSIL